MVEKDVIFEVAKKAGSEPDELSLLRKGITTRLLFT